MHSPEQRGENDKAMDIGLHYLRQDQLMRSLKVATADDEATTREEPPRHRKSI